MVFVVRGLVEVCCIALIVVFSDGALDGVITASGSLSDTVTVFFPKNAKRVYQNKIYCNLSHPI